jgi:2-(1,2-epoxy-1,2-dihydrophenyl)acetyl-CoA isomerase
MSEKQAILEKKDRVATITLNNPQTFNSMSQALLDDTLEMFREAESDPDVRVVIFTGAGKAFCAGADLPYVETFAHAGVTRRYMEGINGVSSAIVHMPKPVIAMVNGVAAGAGCNWVLACDIIYCARSARFAQSFARVGLIPDGGGTYFLTRALGLYRAKELAFTADVIGAQTAYEIGLVNKVFDDDQVREETAKFAGRLAAGAPVAIGMMKKALNQNINLDLAACFEVEIGMQLLCMETEDHKEGIAAFKGKREPVFKGR